MPVFPPPLRLLVAAMVAPDPHTMPLRNAQLIVLPVAATNPHVPEPGEKDNGLLLVPAQVKAFVTVIVVVPVKTTLFGALMFRVAMVQLPTKPTLPPPVLEKNVTVL
jgi:hypothetical protein